MTLSGRQKLAAIFGSLAAISGAVVLQNVVKKRATPLDSSSMSSQQMTKEWPKGRLEAAISESRKLLSKLQEDTGCPGLSVTVSLHGETVWKEGFGFSDLENGVRFSPDSVMKIASISKPITMALFAKEWEKGSLDLDADVRQYVPYWPEKSWAGEKVAITPRQLSSHLAGIRGYKKKPVDKTRSTDGQNDFEYEEYCITKRYKSVKESLGIFKDDPLLSKPGAQFNYTNHGFTLLSAVLEGVAEEKFPVLLERLFHDLGLSNTYVEDEGKIRYNSSRLYTKGEDGEMRNAPFTESSFKIAAAGLLSTTNDLAKFGNIILYSYQRPDGFLKPTTVRMLWTPVADTRVSWDAKGRYGMGWQIVPGQERNYMGHTGASVGLSSVLLISPDTVGEDCDKPRGAVVAILCNLQGVSLARCAMRIADRFIECSRHP